MSIGILLFVRQLFVMAMMMIPLPLYELCNIFFLQLRLYILALVEFDPFLLEIL